MQQLTLSTLLSELEQELIRLGYTEGTLKFYRNRWRKLMDVAREHEEQYYFEQLGIDFVREYFGIEQDDFGKVLNQAQTQELRVIRMVGDFQLHGSILRRYMKHRELLTEPYFIELSGRFHKYCEQKDYSKVTINHYVKQSAFFMDYLTSQGIRELEHVTLENVNAYIRTLAGFTYKTVEQNLCSLRAFFRYLYSEGTLLDDLASKIPMVRARKQTAIPSVWTNDELKKLVGAIDRGSPQGKRDYAIILLACRLGIRCTDIKNLRFDNFLWPENKLSFVQSKTRQPIELPLVPDVGWAVIDYIKS